MGIPTAKELFYTGDAISGRKPKHLGMTNHAWPLSEVEARTVVLANQITDLNADILAIVNRSFRPHELVLKPADCVRA